MPLLPKCPLPVTFEGTKKILEQMDNFICKVHSSSGGFGTGFFCIIPYKASKLKVLITDYHVLSKEYLLSEKKIKIELNNQLKVIDINDNRKIYSNYEFEITIIEINPYKDKINDFLELDECISKDMYTEKGEEIFKLIRINSTAYTPQILSYGKVVSYGTIHNLEEFTIHHLCSTDMGSTGSPILDLRNNKVIGMHTQSHSRLKCNRGTFLFYPIKDFNDDNNLLIINKEYNDKDFSNIKLIKTGPYGKIYSAYSLKDQEEEVCLKRIDIEEMKKNYEENVFKDFQQDLNNEINILKLLSSNENSVKYYGDYNNKNEKVIVMEKCDMNLKEFIIQKKMLFHAKKLKTNLKLLISYFKKFKKKK